MRGAHGEIRRNPTLKSARRFCCGTMQRWLPGGVLEAAGRRDGCAGYPARRRRTRRDSANPPYPGRKPDLVLVRAIGPCRCCHRCQFRAARVLSCRPTLGQAASPQALDSILLAPSRPGHGSPPVESDWLATGCFDRGWPLAVPTRAGCTSKHGHSMGTRCSCYTRASTVGEP